MAAGGITTTGNISATGNITAGNVIATVVGNLTGTTVSVSGNIAGGNITTLGLISATGNVTGNYFIGNGSQLTGVTVAAGNSIVNGTSNVVVLSSANITVSVAGTPNVVVFASTGAYVTGLTSVTGNITGGNINTVGLVTAVGNVQTSLNVVWANTGNTAKTYQFYNSATSSIDTVFL